MKAARILLFVCLTSLLLAIGCGGNSSSTSSNPGPGAPGTSGNGGGNNGGGGGGTTSGSPTELVYVIESSGTSSSVEGFSASPAGSLTRVSTNDIGASARDIVANSKFVFVTSIGSAPANIPLSSYSIGSSGALTLVDNINASRGDDEPNALLLDPPGTHLYMSSDFAMVGGRSSTFAIDATGHMTFQPPDNPIAPLGPMGMSPNGLFVYATTLPRHHTADSETIALFLRDPATGALTTSPQRFHSSSQCCDSYAVYAFDQGGQFLFVLGDRKISTFSVNAATGELTLVTQLSDDFRGMTVDRSGKFVLATVGTSTIASYRINPDGSLAIQGSATAPKGITNSSFFDLNSIAVSGGNKLVYVTSSSTPQISVFSFDQSTGALASVSGSPFPVIAKPLRMAAVGH